MSLFWIVICQLAEIEAMLETRLQSGVLDVAARTEAINWIHKVQPDFGFGPLWFEGLILFVCFISRVLIDIF
ncbi:hypothetical protein P8452_56594 [Trifolium repens]|nr:hypothetical protein P8452_56594 [Trifolium repens]